MPQFVSFVFALIAIAQAATAETRVVDGDTLELDGTIYRLNGIDAPEHGQTCGDWACGAAATDALVELVTARDVSCEPISEDGYGRVVATCYADGQDLSAAMIDKGMAWAFVRYSDAYAPEELISKEKAEGVFASDFMTPWEFRELRWKRAEAREQKAPSGCPIKGNISSNGRIYHTPWSPWFARTKVNTSRGERWFCTETEAIMEGWRAPYWN